ncbi:MAG: M15 family metallopeptidase [Pseudohongiellaceae bacterium]
MQGDEGSAGYRTRIERLHSELGVPPGFAEQRGWPLQPEAASLAEAGPDWYGRSQQLRPDALAAWRRLQQAAAEDGVTVHLISAFRSVDYQCEVIRRKLAAGRTMEDILQVNAVPGFSEHHTGCAVDLGTTDCPALEEAFEHTPAFRWLAEHARRFGFHLSYPRDNTMGIHYEPWHWCYWPDLDKTATRE